jgi:hypothetical protein
MVAAIATLACRSPGQKLDESRRALRSWRSTAAVAAAEWARGRQPTRFTTTVADALRDGVRQERSTLTRIGSDEARSLIAEADALSAAADRLSRALQSGDRAAASALSASLGPPVGAESRP